MSDEFLNVADTVSSPATRAVAVTPDDSLPLANIPKALFIGETGDLVMRGVHDTADLIFKNLTAGSILPFSGSGRYARQVAGRSVPSALHR